MINGDLVLWLIDTKGLPMEVINMQLAERGWGFDVLGFIAACIENPNFNAKRCYRLLKVDSPKELHNAFKWLVEKCYDTEL